MAGNRAEGFGKEEAEKIPKCVVLFRPHNQWEGEYGFDWIRMKQEEIKTKHNGTKGNDISTEDALGKYLNVDCKKHCELTNECKNKNTNPSDTCIDVNGWSNDFEKDRDSNPPALGPMYSDLLLLWFDTLIPIPHGFNRRDTSMNVPLLTIMPNQTAKLTMMVCIKDKEFEGEFIKFKYSEDAFDVTIKGKVSPDITSDPDDYEKWQKIDVELKCLNEFSKRESIEVYYDYPKANIKNQLCGELCILPNTAYFQRQLDVVLVKVRVDIGEGANQGIFENQDITTLEKILRQGYVFIDSNNGDVAQDTLDLSEWKKEFKEKFVESQGNTIKFDGNILKYLNSKLDSKYKNYFKVYSIDETCREAIGFSVDKTNACIVFRGHYDDTVPHELLHAMGLEHTFCAKENFPNAKYTYKAKTTDNVMDYSDLVGISTFCWQWKIMNPKNSI